MTDPTSRLTAALADRYIIERELGAGGMATVYLAHDVRHDRKVAVKVLRPELAAVVGAERFLNEIKVTANLQHPHIVPLFDSGEANGFLFFVMPFVEGESLRERLAREGPLPLEEAIRVIREVADALAYAHSCGVVHRDIKPDNVMVSRRHATVTDFGVARAVSEAADHAGLTTAGMAIGTPTYMAPEQAAADPAIDYRADIYALGILGYELLTGAPPFAERTPQQVLAAHLTEQPGPLAERRPETPPALAAIIDRCLEKDRANRWGRAEDVVRRIEDLAASGSGAVPVRATRRRQWRNLVAVTAGGSLLAAAIAFALLRGGSNERVPTSSTVLAVFPFAVRGGVDVQYLGEGIVSLLATSLDGAGDMRSVDPRALIAKVEREGHQTVSPERAAAMAGELGAGLYILGDIVQVGDRIRIDAALYDGRTGREPIGRGTDDGDPADVLAMVDRVATQLLASGVAAPESRVTQIAAVTTSSLPALKQYLEGENAFRAGRFGPAVEAFQNAVAADSQFALAFYRLSIAAEWALQPELARQAAEGAVRYADRLSEHDRRLLEALLAARRGEAEEAERMFRAIVAVWPQDVDAWLQLGEVQFHYGPLHMGESIAGSAAAFARVLALDPEHVASLIHLLRIAARRGDAAAVDSLGRRIQELNLGGDRTLEMAAFTAVMSNDSSTMANVLGELRRAPELFVPQAAFGTAIWTDQFPGIRRFFEVEIDPVRSHELQALGHVHLAYLDVLQGRWSAATSQLVMAETADSAIGLEHRAFLTLLPFLPVARGEFERLRETLVRWTAGQVSGSRLPSAHFSIHNGLHVGLKRYLLGLVDVRLGDLAAARALARELERLPGDETTSGLQRAFARSLDAAVAEARGDRVAALQTLDRLRRFGNYEPAMFSPFLSLAGERYRLGLLQEATGHTADAARTYRTFEEFNFFDRAFAGPAALHLGRLADHDGRRVDARRHYERFLFLWVDADDIFRPLLDEARSAVARLVAEDG